MCFYLNSYLPLSSTHKSSSKTHSSTDRKLETKHRTQREGRKGMRTKDPIRNLICYQEHGKLSENYHRSRALVRSRTPSLSFLAGNAKRETQRVIRLCVTDGIPHFAKKTLCHPSFFGTISCVPCHRYSFCLRYLLS